MRDWTTAELDYVLHAGDATQTLGVGARIAERPGPILGMQRRSDGLYPYALAPLFIERSVSVNTAAAGGNASLLALG